jgi:hypothetical protein
VLPDLVDSFECVAVGKTLLNQAAERIAELEAERDAT